VQVSQTRKFNFQHVAQYLFTTSLVSTTRRGRLQAPRSLHTYLSIMVGYTRTVLNVWYQCIIRHNNKLIQIIIQILFLKLRNALYINICGTDIIFRLKWVGVSINSYIKCKLVQ
jgi:hypothetical protein